MKTIMNLTFKGRDNDQVDLFLSSNLTYYPLMYFNQIYIVYKAFSEFWESKKKELKKVLTVRYIWAQIEGDSIVTLILM